MNKIIPLMSPSTFNFIKDINYSEMTDKGMLDLLVEFVGTAYFTALLRYNDKRGDVLNSIIYNTDPVKEPTRLSRQQGFQAGLWDLVDAMVIETNNRKKDKEEQEKNKQ